MSAIRSACGWLGKWTGLPSLLPVLLVMLFASTGFAQVPTGSVTGTVADTQGLPIEGVTVTLINQGTNATFTSVTASAGGYQFEHIDYGLYTVRATKDGFKSGEVTNIKLDASTVYSVKPIILEVGAKTEAVVVEAGAELVNTTSAEVSGTVEKQQIEDLPILNRNPMALLGLQAGVSQNGAVETTINGQRSSFSNVTLDGMNIQDNFIRTNDLDFTPNLPFNGQAQEFTIITQNADVENGGGSSQVSIVTPKGTNAFHGEGFWYYRSNSWAANNWFNDASGVPLASLLQNQAGGNLGGPIKKDKLFVYGYYELLRSRAQSPNDTTVLSPTILAALAGSTPTLPFTYQPINATTGAPDGPVQSVNLFTMSNNARGNPVFSGGNYVSGAPVFTPDPAILTLLSHMPTTFNNTRVGDGVNLLGDQLNARSDNSLDNYGARVDYNANSKNSFTGTWAWNRQVVDRPDIDTSFNKIPLVQNNDSIKFLSTAWRWSPRADLTNEVRFGFDLAPAYFKTAQNFSPGFILNDSTLPFTDPNPNFLPQGRDTHTWEWQDNANWVKGNHILKFGAQIERVTIYETNSAGIYPSYSLGFSSANPYGPAPSDFPTPNPNQDTVSVSAFNNATNILAGIAGILSSESQSFNVRNQTSGFVPLLANSRNYRQNDWSFYLGDNWRINRKLTLTLGTRYEYFSPVDERNGLVLLPQIAAGSTVQQTLSGNATVGFAGGPSPRPLYSKDFHDFAPNVGLAWDPFGDGKTAIRAGFSMNYVNDEFFTAVGNAAAGNAGLSPSVTDNGPTGFGLFGPTVSAPDTLAAPPFQVPIDFLTEVQNLGDFVGGVAGYSIDPHIRTPYVEQWNLSVQRDIGWNTSLTVSYIGNHGVGLWRAIDLNQLQFTNNGFLADFNRARNNLFLTGDPTCTTSQNSGCQALTVFPLLPFEGFVGQSSLVDNYVLTGQIGALESLYHADGFDQGNNPLPGPNNVVNFFPNPYIMGADLLKNTSFSSYNAGVVEVRRRFSRGLYFQGNYTYSKTMTDFGGSQSQFQPFQDNARPQLEKQRAPFDLTHAFKANFTYELPIGKGHRLFGSRSRVLGLLTDGWETGSVFTWQSGAPFSILSQLATFNRTGSRSVNNTAIATLTHGQISGDLGVFEQPNGTVDIVNPSLISSNGTGAPLAPQLSCVPAVTGGFCNPQPGQVGNLQLDAFNGPVFFDWDTSASKDFNLTERFKLTFRAEAFNVLNHPVFFAGDPSLGGAQSINSTTFGQSTTLTSTPRILQLSLRLKF
ncbi:MAG TPA: TonB-dependent receptor [Candidatus Acidoferrum sp.]|nr:TonB-dependent receptor [Candidatus Acidoferrum sp.]